MDAGASRAEPSNLMRIIPTEEKKMRNTKLITMIEGAIIAGVCVALSYIPLNTANAAFDLSLGLIPLGVYSLRRGLVPGMAAGFIWGLLLIALGKAWILSIPQVLLEYPIAFAFGGFGGIFSKRLSQKLAYGNAAGTAKPTTAAAGHGTKATSMSEAGTTKATTADAGGTTKPTNTGEVGIVLTVVFASVAAAVARWFFHFWAGVVFWSSTAPEVMNGMSPYLYSFFPNAASAAANAAMLAIILVILVRAARKLFIPPKSMT